MDQKIALLMIGLLLCGCNPGGGAPIEITATPPAESPPPRIVEITATNPPASATPTDTPPPTFTPTPSWRPVAIGPVRDALSENGYRRYPFSLDDGSGGFRWIRESSYEVITTWDDDTLELEVVHDPSPSTRVKQLERMFEVLDTVLPREFMDQLREAHAAYNRTVGANVSGEPDDIQAFGGEWKTVWAEYYAEELAIGGYGIRFSVWWWQSTCPPQYLYCYYLDFPGLEFTGDSSMLFHTIMIWPIEEGEIITQQASAPTPTLSPAIAALEPIEGQMIWFGPNQRTASGSIPYDVYNIFNPDAPWESCREQLDVFLFPMQEFPRILPGRPNYFEEEIRTRVDFSLVHEIPIAIVSQAIVDYDVEPWGEPALPTTCDGLENAQFVLSQLKRVYQYGGEVSYFTMENPFLYASRKGYPNGCNFSDEELSHQLLDFLRVLRAKYPGIRIGLMENIHCHRVGIYAGMCANRGNLIEALDTLLRVVREGGEQLDFFHAFLPYDWALRYGGLQGWQKLKALEDHVHDQGLRFGVIYTSERGGNTSDEMFYEDVLMAKVRYEEVGGNPDDFIIDSWLDHPKTWLPEEEPYTFTNLLMVFMQSSSEEILDLLSQ